MIRKLDHINIVVSNIARAKAFFMALGFQAAHQGRLTGPWVSALVGLKDVDADYVALELPGCPTKVELIEYHNPSSGPAPGISKANQLGLRHLALEVDDIEGAAARLSQMGAELFSPIQEYSPLGKKLVYLLGPDGIILELAQYGSSSA